jgi:hypothetical protein
VVRGEEFCKVTRPVAQYSTERLFAVDNATTSTAVTFSLFPSARQRVKRTSKAFSVAGENQILNQSFAWASVFL